MGIFTFLLNLRSIPAQCVFRAPLLEWIYRQGSTDFPVSMLLPPENSREGCSSMSTITTNQAVPLAAPYRRKIGKVTFEVSSFGSPQATSTAEDLLLGMLEARVTREEFGEEAQSA